MKILIATPCAGGLVRYEYALALLTETFNHPDRLQQQDHYGLALYLTGGYSGLPRDRAVIASYALRNGFDKLVFIDSDMRWRWEDLKKLLDSKRDIISGIAPLKQYPIRLNINPLPEDSECFKESGGVVAPHSLAKWLEKHDDAAEIPVTVVGTAFLCIDVKVLKKMATTCEPFMFNDPQHGSVMQCWDFFASGAIENIYLGEDWGFCVQARRAGFEIYVNPSVRIDHIGDHTYRVDSNIGIVAVDGPCL